MSNKFLVGSRAFFGNIEGFHSKDYDYLEIVDNPVDFKYRKELQLRGTCLFKVKKESPENMIQRVFDLNSPLMMGKFFIPEVVETLGITVEHILPLESMIEKLDEKHKYLEVIFHAIKQNNSFILSDEQRQEAYKVYLAAREKKAEKEN